MRRYLLGTFMLLSLAPLGTPAAAGEPPEACLAAPDEVCLLVWAKDEAVAAFSSGADVSSTAFIIAQDLYKLGRETDAIELVNADPDASLRKFALEDLRKGAKPPPAMLASRFDTLLSGHDFAGALANATSPRQYATVALQAAMAQDETTAKVALSKFEQFSWSGRAGLPKVMELFEISCRLKSGFAHVLLADDVDLDGLIRDSETQLNAIRDTLLKKTDFASLLWWFTSWNIAALKILRGQPDPIPQDVPEDTPFGRAIMLGGPAAVAVTIGDGKAVPFLREAMKLVPEMSTPDERANLLHIWARLLGEHTIAGDNCR